MFFKNEKSQNHLNFVSKKLKSLEWSKHLLTNHSETPLKRLFRPFMNNFERLVVLAATHGYAQLRAGKRQ